MGNVDYYNLLGLTREPFSNSPDPVFFFKAQNHAQCLHRLEIAVRLRRGLNVCLGQIGSGKSTLCRALIQQLALDDSIVVHLILDPSFADAKEFLITLHSRLLGASPPREATHRELMEGLKTFLFQEALEKKKIVLLIIDEGQKLSRQCLEALRELLNYETNEAKLLQTIIFAQEEFDATLAELPNFQDRINECCRLTSLGFWETKALVEHRLKLAGTSRRLFTWPAYWVLYRAARGRPRKLMHLGHKALLTMIVRNQKRVDRTAVLSCLRDPNWEGTSSPWRTLFAGFAFLAACCIPLGLNEVPTAPSRQAETNLPAEFRGPVAPGTYLALYQDDPDLYQNDDLLKQPGTETAPPSGPTANQVSRRPAGERTQAGKVSSCFTVDKGVEYQNSLYYLQVGGYLLAENAQRALTSLRERVATAGMITVQYLGQQWRIVYVDSFADLDQAIGRAGEWRDAEGDAVVIVEVEGLRYRCVWE